MKTGRKVLVAMTVLLAGLLTGSHAFAKTAAEQKPTAPPYGLATQGDAAGTKLYGVVETEYSNPAGITNECAEVRAVLRLRKGNDIVAFNVTPGDVYSAAFELEAELCATTTFAGIKIGSPEAVQMILLEAFRGQILNSFFNGDQTLTIFLKNVGDLGTSFSPPPPTAFFTNIFNVLDVEIAVH